MGVWQIKGWERDYLDNRLRGVLGEKAEIKFFEEILGPDDLAAESDYEIVSVFVGAEINKTVIAALPNLKLITTRSTGFDHIDIAAAKARGIQVAYVPTYGENTVAEHAFGLLLNLAHRIYEGYDRLREKGVYSYEGLEGFDLKEKTIGIVGTGHIGVYAIRIAKGLGMRVIAYDVTPRAELEEELGFKYAENLEALLEAAEVVSIHVPYLPATHHLIHKGNIGRMKKGAILINTARGAIVETAALVRALREGKLGGAGLDVLEEEGVMKDELGYLLSGEDKSDIKVVIENHALIDMPNVIVTPHSAFNTREAKQRILEATVKNIEGFFKNGKAANLAASNL